MVAWLIVVQCMIHDKWLIVGQILTPISYRSIRRRRIEGPSPPLFFSSLSPLCFAIDPQAYSRMGGSQQEGAEGAGG